MGVTAERIGLLDKDASGPKESEHRPAVLVQRDRELFVHLAIARFLTTKQIRRLVFPDAADSVARRRLNRLADGEHAYLSRIRFQTRADGPVVAWSLRPLGHMVARNLFSSVPELPRHTLPASEFLEQIARLNELYMALAAAAASAKLPFDRWPFRWRSGDAARLPWSELNREKESSANHLIYPDAVLELPGEKRRCFIRVENGLHALALRRGGALARNTLKLKIERYTRFILTPTSNLDNETFYLRSFSDGWPAEVLFIVPTASHRDAIAEYVAGTWRPSNDAVQLTIRALTFAEAPPHLCRAAQLPAESARAPDVPTADAITADEIQAVYAFYNGTISAIAAVRQFVRGQPQLASSFPLPEYPPNHHQMKQICLRLAERLDGE